MYRLHDNNSATCFNRFYLCLVYCICFTNCLIFVLHVNGLLLLINKINNNATITNTPSAVANYVNILVKIYQKCEINIAIFFCFKVIKFFVIFPGMVQDTDLLKLFCIAQFSSHVVTYPFTSSSSTPFAGFLCYPASKNIFYKQVTAY